jgi:hypothetical protein
MYPKRYELRLKDFEKEMRDVSGCGNAERGTF